MAKLSISEILDDIRISEEVLQKFERRYWITSEQFFELYSQGLLDNGQYTEDFSEWAGYFKLKRRREQSFQKLGEMRIDKLRSATINDNIQLTPQEPMIEA
jgi:hypothetical protein